MRFKTHSLILLLSLIGLLLAACSPAAPQADAAADAAGSAEMAEEPMAEPTHETMDEDAPMEESSGDEEAESFHWLDRSYTDVRTGETFTIEDFAGKVVLVETMAMWCPTCLSQQHQVQDLHEALGNPADLISISLDVDPREDAAGLAEYADTNGFDWYFLIAEPAVARALSTLYSPNYLNPPSAPILLVDREGNVHQLDFGLKRVDALQAFVQPFLEQ